MVAAARAGKDVYVEKPLSPSIQQDFLARSVIQQTKRVFQYGTQQRDAGHVRFGCELVRSGRIGNIREVEVISPTGAPGGSTASMPVPAGFDYGMWQGPAPERSYNDDRCLRPGHYHIYDYSIGFLGGWGAHPLDVLDWGLPTPMVPVEYGGRSRTGQQVCRAMVDGLGGPRQVSERHDPDLQDRTGLDEDVRGGGRRGGL